MADICRGPVSVALRSAVQCSARQNGTGVRVTAHQTLHLPILSLRLYEAQAWYAIEILTECIP